jgi:prephenate dehydrogenase
LIGKINKKSNKPEDVIPGSKVVIICTPAHTKVEILKNIAPYLEKDSVLGTIFC